MAKDKNAQELAELAAEQGKHAAKNIGKAAVEAVEEVLPTVTPEDFSGLAVSIRVSNTVLVGAAVAGAAVATAKVYKEAKRFKTRREVKKNLEKAEERAGLRPVEPDAA